MYCFLDVPNIKEHEVILALKIDKLLQKEDTIIKISKIIEDKLTVKNVLTFYCLAKYYNLTTISESYLLYIERCFPMVVETQNFLHLNFKLVAKILASSELNIHSEVEVLNAAITWLKYNIEERSKYAKQLLLKVRLSLLSEHAKRYILEKVLSLTNNNKCISVLKGVIAENKTSFQNNKIRHCSQNKFNLLVCCGFNKKTRKHVRDMYQFDGSNLNNVKRLPSMITEIISCKAVFLKGEVYVFGGRSNCGLTCVEKYSPTTNAWNEVAKMFDERTSFVHVHLWIKYLYLADIVLINMMIG